MEGRINGRRIQASLGTRNYDNALQYTRAVERAILGGPKSEEWPRLKNVLPESVFRKLAVLVGYVEQPESIEQANKGPAQWEDLKKTFAADCERRIALGKMQHSTWSRYDHTLAEFGEFLKQASVANLAAITRSLVEQFKIWRAERIRKKKFSRGARGLALDVAILHRVFSWAIDLEMLQRNPVRLEGRPGDEPENGAQPFKADQLARLREAAGPDLLAFLVLRWTGLRGSDVVRLKWGEVDLQLGEITRLTLKRRKRVFIPMHAELRFALEAEFQRCAPAADDLVLVNPGNGKPLTRPRLYERIRALGKRANVTDAHPHRFRDSFCVDMLARGVNPYSVARLVGITVEMLERHYAPFIPELRERVRTALETGHGLEPVFQQSADPPATGKDKIQ